MPKFVSSLVLIIAAASIAACGSDAKKVSTAAYRTSANAVCKTYNAKTKNLSPKSDSDADIKSFIHEGVTLTKQEVSELRKLPKPQTDADKYSKLYDDVEARFESLDSKSAAEIKKLPSTFSDDLDRRARALGITDCATSA